MSVPRRAQASARGKPGRCSVGGAGTEISADRATIPRVMRGSALPEGRPRVPVSGHGPSGQFAGAALPETEQMGFHLPRLLRLPALALLMSTLSLALASPASAQ